MRNRGQVIAMELSLFARSLTPHNLSSDLRLDGTLELGNSRDSDGALKAGLKAV